MTKATLTETLALNAPPSQFQSFAEMGGPGPVALRVAQLRAALSSDGLDGFIVPRADEHQNEYVPAAAERLMWLTGFSGSAGLAIILKHKAAIFVDGRYATQAPQQVDTGIIDVRPIAQETPAAWLERCAIKGERIGYDPWLHTPEAVERFEGACAKVGAELVALAQNPIDAIWRNRPAPPLGAIRAHPKKYSGQSAAQKLARLRKAIDDCDGLLISDPHGLAWLFNIRGADVDHTPLPLGFAFAPREGKPTIFLDGRKLSNAMRSELAELAEIEAPTRLLGFIDALGAQRRRIRFDAATAPSKLTQALKAAGGQPIVGPDPLALMKAVKNSAELKGARAAHLRDGVAMAQFLAWFAREAPKGELTEISAALALEAFRSRDGRLKDLSFPSISAAGPHAAIPHYRVSDASNLRIGKGLFLIDSGAQYEDGTTDITRTVAVGRPSAEMRDRFTRVLKGHVAIAAAVFPVGTSGMQIDALARQALWQAGFDFEHGVGHGVGAYLGVHEGPQRIAKSGAATLAPGMILSNEPGYYAAGRYGIRIENLIVVERRTIIGAERDMLGFATLSLAPIDLALVEPRLLSAYERNWLNAYHARVRREISPLVDAPTRRWLREATRRLG